MTQSDVTYIGDQAPGAAARMAALGAQRLSLGAGPDARVTVLDGSDLGDAALDAQLAAIDSGRTAVLVLFTLSHGISFRARREALLAAGARDVMAAKAPEDEFLTRVRALLHLSRPPRVLIVEDEDEIGVWAVQVLGEAGMDVTRATSLAEAEALFEAGPIDALVVDRGLPDGDGLDLVARLRGNGIRTPALVLSALTTIESRLQGLRDAGADDYICKPVHADELVVRVQMLLRPKITDEVLVFGPLEVNRADRVVRWRGDRITLRPKEVGMLIYLAERDGLPIPQRMIYLDVWEKTYMEEGSNPVTSARHRLGTVLKAFLKERGEAYEEFIATVDDGYVFQPEVLLRLPEGDAAGA
ncbi:MAG: response regulator transcription factor [Silicimonas sp.]|nr:response regulator transcription factor [Silicimonas sp.]